MLGDRAAGDGRPAPPYLTFAASRRDRRRRCSTYVGARALCAVVSHIALDQIRLRECLSLPPSPAAAAGRARRRRRRVPCHRAQ